MKAANKGEITVPNDKSWMLPKVTDYFDSQTDAIQRFVDKLKNSRDVERDVSAIREAVSEHMRVLPPQWVFSAAVAIVDDLYKTGNSLPLWDEHHGKYIEASAGSFFQLFRDKGFVLRYGINNGFEQTDSGMQRPLYLLPALFAAAGLVYICPQAVGLLTMEHDGIPGSDFLTNYGRYEAESRHMALMLLGKCKKSRRSFVVLELGDDDALLKDFRSAALKENVVTVFRCEPPIAGSKIDVRFPKGVESPVLGRTEKQTPSA